MWQKCMTDMTKHACSKLLTWLKLLVDVAFLIWFSIKIYVIYMFIYNDIMEC
jgi:hypothetical protein